MGSSGGRVGVILLQPPEGHYKIIGIYIDSETGKLVVTYDDKPTE